MALPDTTRADLDEAVEAMLSAETAPPGVVFEVVQSDRQALDWALPKVREAIGRLRARFPGLAVAVISHGLEQFSLLADQTDEHQGAHALARSLLGEADVPVEVCGNHARMYGHRAEDYPDYVVVVDAAPRQIARYTDKGYRVVVVSRP